MTSRVSAQRVVRRYLKAEVLTKSWLMGVRRGWLSLLKPHITDWNDVFRAIQKLEDFVNNFKDQVTIVRRDPYSFDTPELKKSFENLIKAISSQYVTAVGWKSMADTPHFGRADDAAKMLEIYKASFSGVMTTRVKTRRKPGVYIKDREADLTELLDKILGILRGGAAVLERGDAEAKEYWGTPSFKEFSFGKMKVVVNDPKSHGGSIPRYVKEIDKAFQLTDRKGFGKLWYGTLFIESSSYRNLSPQEIEAYKACGYANLRSTAGTYMASNDVVTLTLPPDGLAETLIHELGHRFWFKFMGQSQRAKFETLVKVNVPGKKQNIPQELEVASLSKAEKYINDSLNAVREAVYDLVYNPRQNAKDVRTGYQKIKTNFDSFITNIYLVSGELTAYMSQPAIKAFHQTDSDRRNQEKRVMASCVEAIKKLDEFIDYTPYDESQWAEFLINWSETARTELTTLGGLVFQFISGLDQAQSEYVQKIKDETEPHIDPNDPRSILPVSEYGKSHIDEAFAEAFAFYVLGEDMNRDQLESFRSVLASSKTRTKEMENWFEKRTKMHIDLVQKYCRLIEAYDARFKGLSVQAENHDQSKYEEPERTPYIYTTWQYYCKGHNKKFEAPEGMEEKMNVATQHHVVHNLHHPEYYHVGPVVDFINREDRDKPPKTMVNATKMPDLSIAEMVADWLAMSEEKKTKPKEWADKNVNIRWKFTPEQKEMIYELIGIFG